MSFPLSYGIFFTLLTSISFGKLNEYLYYNPYGMPQNLIDNEYMSWKWRNTLVSLIHSLISAFAGLLSLVFEPSLALDMMFSYSDFGYCVVCFSNGYFIYDLMLSLLNVSYPGRLEIIVHHILTITSLTFSTVTKRFLGYVLTALVVEVSNIFLHLRQIFQIIGINAKSKTYRINSIITIISMIISRLLPLSWIVFCLYMENCSMSFLVWLSATFCAIVILIVSVGIIVRVAVKDFIKTDRHFD